MRPVRSLTIIKSLGSGPACEARMEPYVSLGRGPTCEARIEPYGPYDLLGLGSGPVCEVRMRPYRLLSPGAAPPVRLAESLTVPWTCRPDLVAAVT